MTDVVEYSVALAHKHKTHIMEETKKLPITRLVTVLLISLVATIGELVIAQMSHSITLLVLVHQSIYNSLSVIVAIVSSKLSRDNSLKTTFGWHRVEVVGSIASLVFLFSLCFATTMEAAQTLFHSGHLDTMHNPDWILLLMAAHTIIWCMVFFLAGGYTHLQNSAVSNPKTPRKTFSRQSGSKFVPCMKSYLSKLKISEVSRDLQGVVFVSLTCFLIKYSILRDQYLGYLDPIIALVFIISLVSSSSGIFKASSLILLQTIPGDVEVAVLRNVLLAKFTDIIGIHEMHVWSLSPSKLILTAHISFNSRQAYIECINPIEDFLYEHGFSMMTLQPEFPNEDEPNKDGGTECTLVCKHEDCKDKTCCKPETHKAVQKNEEENVITHL